MAKAVEPAEVGHTTTGCEDQAVVAPWVRGKGAEVSRPRFGMGVGGRVPVRVSGKPAAASDCSDQAKSSQEHGVGFWFRYELHVTRTKCVSACTIPSHP